MNEIWTTVCGNVVKDPVYRRTDDGLSIAKFRVATTPYTYSKTDGRVDGPTTYVTVTCFRWLAENAGGCIGKGDPIIAFGKLSVNEYESKDGHVGHDTEIVASAIGHDLNRGTAMFRRGARGTRLRAVSAEGAAAPDDEQLAAGLAPAAAIDRPDDLAAAGFQDDFGGSFAEPPAEPEAADDQEADAA